MSRRTFPCAPVALRRYAPLAILAVAGIGFIAAGWHRYVSFSAIADNRVWLCNLAARLGVAAVIGYVAVYAAAVAMSLPGAAALTIAGGFLFGTWLGGGCAVIGATLGATAVFLAARAGFSGLARRAGPRLGKLEAGFAAHAFNYLLALRLVPLFPFWLVNLAPALAGVGPRTFMLATCLGIIPGTFVYASLGNGLRTAVEEPDLGILLRPGVFGPMLGLAGLALVPVCCRRRRRGGR